MNNLKNLYYGTATDSTVSLALNDTATSQSTPTINAMETAILFMDYMNVVLFATIVYYAWGTT